MFNMYPALIISTLLFFLQDLFGQVVGSYISQLPCLPLPVSHHFIELLSPNWLTGGAPVLVAPATGYSRLLARSLICLRALNVLLHLLSS